MTNTQPRNDAATPSHPSYDPFPYNLLPAQQQKQEREPHVCRVCGAPARSNRAYYCDQHAPKAQACYHCGGYALPGVSGMLIHKHCDKPACVAAAAKEEAFATVAYQAFRRKYPDSNPPDNIEHEDTYCYTEHQLDQYGEPLHSSELHPVQHVNIDTEGRGQ